MKPLGGSLLMTGIVGLDELILDHLTVLHSSLGIYT